MSGNRGYQNYLESIKSCQTNNRSCPPPPPCSPRALLQQRSTTTALTAIGPATASRPANPISATTFISLSVPMDTAMGAALTNPGGPHEVLATAPAATSAGKPREHIQRVRRTAQ